MAEKPKRDFSKFQQAHEKMVDTNFTSWREYARDRFSDKTSEEILEIVKKGDSHSFRDLSREYFRKDGLYKELVFHYATLLKYRGILIPRARAGKKLSAAHIEKRYHSATDFISSMDLPTLLTGISLKVLVHGEYFGFLNSLNKKEFSLVPLPPTYCRSNHTDILGRDLIEFNIRFFYTILNDKTRLEVLNSYPEVIREHYLRFQEGKTSNYWVELPPDISVYFSFTEDGLPFFADSILAISKYNEAIEEERERNLEEIRKIIVQKIPHLPDGSLLFETDEALEMHNASVGMMRGNRNISVLTTYADIEAVTSKTSETKSTTLPQMLQNFYSVAGVSPQLFAPTSSQTLKTSIQNDLSIMMILGNKYSKFISNILNLLFSNSNVSFSYQILPISQYNVSDFISDSLKLAQSGYSFLLPSIALDIDQSSLTNLKELENEVLNLKNVLIPLSSSYTQSTDSKGGAPRKEVEDKAPATIVRENEGGKT